MASKYVKKSSIQGMVDIAKTQAGVNDSLTLPQGVVDTINAIEPIVNRGSPSVLLSANSENDKTYPIPKGRFTGGTVTVNPQEKTVTPTTKKQTIAADTNRALKKVTVQPTPLYKVKTGHTAALKNATSISINVDFKPEGAIISYSSYGSVNNYSRIVGVTNSLNGLSMYGFSQGGSATAKPGGRVQTPVTLGTNSVTVTNPTYLNPSGTSKAGLFSGIYVYVIWGK